MSSDAVASYRQVVDKYGRSYRVGESPEALTGMPRWVFIVVPWIAMMLISTFEYGWGTAEDTLGKVYGWNLNQLSWLFTMWVIFEAGASFPTGWLRERDILPPRRAVFIGGIAVAVSFIMLTASKSPWVAFVGWTVIGGLGAGMIYSSCINIASKWYPDRKGLRTGLINGGFAYGSVPFIYLLGATFHVSDFKQVLILLGVGLGAGLLVCSRFFRDPPKDWWPAEVDPIQFREAAEQARELGTQKNPQAVRQWPIELSSRTPQLYLLWFNMVVILAVGISEFMGRHGAMRLTFAIMVVGQLGLLWGAKAHSFAIFLIASGVTGLCVGMQFPLFATITADYYGESVNAQNYGVVYSAKIPGGLAGGVLGAWVITHLGNTAPFTISAVLAFIAILLTFTHKQPPLEQYEHAAARGKLVTGPATPEPTA